MKASTKAPSTEAPTTKKTTAPTMPPTDPSQTPSTAAPTAAPTAPPTALPTAPPTAKPTASSKVPSPDLSTSPIEEASDLSKLGEMENLIEELNFQNQQIQTQLKNYKENSENWDSTKENFQMGVFMSVMIIFLCFLLSKVCKLPLLTRVKYGAL